MINLINYKNKKYPYYETEGWASQYIFPFANKVCNGVGYDIGCNRVEWAFPGSIPIDKTFNNEYDAYNLPNTNVDYIFSSHCLEHLDNWVDALDYWTSCLRSGGVMFLYLPDYSQEYWRPWNNKKHKHIFTNEILNDYMVDRGYINIFYSERDLNDSFAILGEKHG